MSECVKVHVLIANQDILLRPVGLYLAWLRLVLTGIIPVGLMTTIPAQAIRGELSPGMLLGCVVFALTLRSGASLAFHWGLLKYTGVSS
ncbi:MAG: ABC-2 family transporter protein [Ktedonobacteraceae bacterium]